MALCFFDSCGLQHRYFPSAYTAQVDELIDRFPDSCYIAEWSILEMSSALANRVRQGKLPLQNFDDLNSRFLEDVANGRLQVLNLSTRHYLRARNLIRYAGVVRNRKLKSGDAMVATVAQALAIDRVEKVDFYTSDWGLYDILRGVDAFSSRLNLVLLGTPKN